MEGPAAARNRREIGATLPAPGRRLVCFARHMSQSCLRYRMWSRHKYPAFVSLTLPVPARPPSVAHAIALFVQSSATGSSGLPRKHGPHSGPRPVTGYATVEEIPHPARQRINPWPPHPRMPGPTHRGAAGWKPSGPGRPSELSPTAAGEGSSVAGLSGMGEGLDRTSARADPAW